MTLTDREYQRLRDAARAVMTEIGVETGGSNVQFAVNPQGRPLPRHRDEPARVALERARLEGHRAIPSRRSRRSSRSATRSTSSRTTSPKTSAAFEPTIDYVVVKWPRFAFEKFPGADNTLGTQMKSVGEVMASAARSARRCRRRRARSRPARDGLVVARRPRRLPRARGDAEDARATSAMDAPPELEAPKTPAAAERRGAREALASSSPIPTRRPALLRRRRDARAASRPTRALRAHRRSIRGFSRRSRASSTPRSAIAAGDSARRAARGQAPRLLATRRSRSSRGTTPRTRPRARASEHGVRPVYARVDTCAAEFVAHTPYLYSTYEIGERERAPTRQAARCHPRRRPEPHRAGDRVRLLLRARGAWRCASSGFETMMVNCNPETVSTDYDTSDRLYFEPLTLEDVLAICDEERSGARGRHRAVRRADAAQARRAARAARA